MPQDWPNPRVFLLAAIATGLFGIILLYVGLLTIAPLFILAFVLLSILGIIATTVMDIRQVQVNIQDSTEQQD